MTAYGLGKNLKVPRTRIERIVSKTIGITPDTALRLTKFFRITPEFWRSMQADYELKTQAPALQAILSDIAELDAA